MGRLTGDPPLPRTDALIEAESTAWHFPVLCLDTDVFNTALRGCAAYGFSWLHARLSAHAECFGLPEIVSEDFERGRHCDRLRVVNPFLPLSDSVKELPEMCEP